MYFDHVLFKLRFNKPSIFSRSIISFCSVVCIMKLDYCYEMHLAMWDYSKLRHLISNFIMMPDSKKIMLFEHAVNVIHY